MFLTVGGLNSEVPVWSLFISNTSVFFFFGPSDIEPFLFHPEPLVLYESNMTVLDCVTGYSAPSPQVHWEKDGERVLYGVQEVAQFGELGLAGSRQISMHLEFVGMVELSGSYQCISRNQLSGEIVRSNPAFVNITCECDSFICNIYWRVCY